MTESDLNLVKLSKTHQWVLNHLKNYYETYQHVPGQRAFLNYLKKQSPAPPPHPDLDPNLVPCSSLWFIKLFSDHAIQTAVRLADLPKGRCL